ncbi:hypothetical protein C8R45DRAFT_934467 [Mycena sanguinolenta]|nr:hypothetical protein C8R45DRAFT_934467 [Mycena sanguinolenta]
MSVLAELQKCMRYIGEGILQAYSLTSLYLIQSLVAELQSRKIRGEIDNYMKAPNITEAARLIPQWSAEIQTRHAGASLRIFIHYLETSASLDAPPYRYTETHEFIEPQTIPLSSEMRRSIESALEKIIYDLHKLFTFWIPEDDPEERICLPASVIGYLNFRTSMDALWRFVKTCHRQWGCVAMTLLNGPSRTHPSSSCFSKDPDRTQTLKALWNILRAGHILIEHEDEPIIPSLRVATNLLDVLFTMPSSPEAMSVITLVENKILNRLHRLADGTTEDHILQLNHPLLPTETAVTVPVEDLRRSLNDGTVQKFRNVLLDRVAEARIVVISEYLEWCSSEISPFNFAKTLQRFLSVSSGDVVLEALDGVIKNTLQVYTPITRLARPHIRGLQLYPYLENHVAREIIKDAFIEYKNTVTAMDPPLPDLLSSMEEIINSLDFMHPPRDQISENVGEMSGGEALDQLPGGIEIEIVES